MRKDLRVLGWLLIVTGLAILMLNLATHERAPSDVAKIEPVQTHWLKDPDGRTFWITTYEIDGMRVLVTEVNYRARVHLLPKNP